MAQTIMPEMVDFVCYQNKALQTKVNDMLKNSDAPKSFTNKSAIVIEIQDDGPQAIMVRIKVGPKDEYMTQWNSSGKFTKHDSALHFIRGCLLALESYLKEEFKTYQEVRQ